MINFRNLYSGRYAKAELVDELPTVSVPDPTRLIPHAVRLVREDGYVMARSCDDGEYQLYTVYELIPGLLDTETPTEEEIQDAIEDRFICVFVPYDDEDEDEEEDEEEA